MGHVEPIWAQLEALLPEHETDHPLGCHRRRIPDRVVFEKRLQILVVGCAYWRIADEGCSATTLRRRRDEWIEEGTMDALREMVLGVYDRLIGLVLGDLAVDGCITKAPCGGEKPAIALWSEVNEASSTRRSWTLAASPSESSPLRPTATTCRCWTRPWTPWKR